MLRIDANKHYSMQASHNELSSSIFQRHVCPNTLVVVGLNLHSDYSYTTILLVHKQRNCCKTTEFTFQAKAEFFEQNVLFCNVVKWVGGENVVL